MNGGTVIGNGTGGGVLFNNQVTFDASGAALLGTSVNGGNWTIGTTTDRVQGHGLYFANPSGAVEYGTLNIANTGGGQGLNRFWDRIAVHDFQYGRFN